MKAIFALLSKLASMLTNWQNAQLAELDARHQTALQRADALEKRAANAEQLNAQLKAENAEMRVERVSFEQQLKDAKAYVQKLENDLIEQQKEIARLSDHDAVRSDILGASANGGHK